VPTVEARVRRLERLLGVEDDLVPASCLGDPVACGREDCGVHLCVLTNNRVYQLGEQLHQLREVVREAKTLLSVMRDRGMVSPDTDRTAMLILQQEDLEELVASLTETLSRMSHPAMRDRFTKRRATLIQRLAHIRRQLEER